MKTSDKGIFLMSDFERLRAKAYKCPSKVWTIGYGHTKGVKPTDHITIEGAILLSRILKETQGLINTCAKVFLNQNQFDALFMIYL